jgi:hypothetical protein
MHVSKYSSYYDWKLQFQKSKDTSARAEKNSLGLTPRQFKAFLTKWKEKNL